MKDIKHNKELIAEIEDELRKLLPLTGYKLHTMPGIDLVTEAQIISEIGDINHFPDSDKLARFMGLAPVQFSSAGKGKDQRCRNGNRALNAIFHFLAIQMVAYQPQERQNIRYFGILRAEGQRGQEQATGACVRGKKACEDYLRYDENQDGIQAV